MGLGLEQAGFDVAVAAELDEVTGRYAQFNLPATAVLYGAGRGNVRRLSAEILAAARPDRAGQEVALISGGPPCQGFSLAGRMNSGDPRNGLIGYFASVVLEVKPLAFCIENVPGIVRGNSGALKRVLRRLRREYEIADPEHLWAHDFGVPQARERVFVVGLRRDLKLIPSLPCPTHAGTASGPDRLAPIVVRQAISDLPSVKNVLDGDHRTPYTAPPRSVYARRMRGVAPDVDDLSVPIAWDARICRNMAPTTHGPAVLKRFQELSPGCPDPVSGVYRLRLDAVGTTIRAGTTREHGSRSAPRPVHPREPRVLTTRECARLQGFPDWFEFHPTRWHGNRQVGNAVPPILARTVGIHILALLGIQRPARPVLAPVTRDRTILGVTER